MQRPLQTMMSLALLAALPLAAAAGGGGALLAAAPGWLAAMLLMMAITTGLLASLHVRERHVFFLSAMMLGWVLLRISLGRPEPWLPMLLLALILLCGVQFLLRQLGWSRGWIDAALLAQLLLAPLSVALAGESLQALLLRLWPALLMLELLAAMAWQLRLRRHALRASLQPDETQQSDFVMMSWLLGVSALLLLAEQMSLLQTATVARLPALQPWLALSLPLLMLALGLHVCVGFARARSAAERRHEQIEQRLHERVAEVERNFSTMAELKLEQVTERERKRIAADLHDDLGAKLLTIVHTSESDRISTLAREALEEMRLSVRGLTGKPVQLLDALGDWRAEVVSRLAQANILAEWKSPAEDIIHTLPARAYVQTTRIFREAVSNIIKHSGATHCTVGCNVQGGDFLVVIQDNGQGISTELDGRLDRGHGMASMKARAKQMHGQCLVESGPGWGTVIRLTIPL
ncbi:sensor histidine kinase [Roseateles violae]|uniref:histidine kinase n=1 Tax=Roseateles violae TaxID=3058042 RepID=A0ABT8DJX1_9BURK|nr:ATP-binding protein [Pelomonas sp. PFR6]MDN3918672.1 ATP-binding protein [Pelomonas sp. PFR6]